MDEKGTSDLPDFGPALTKIRKLRLFLWGVILVYLPAMWVTLESGHSDKVMTVFFTWLFFLIVAVSLAATVKCPGCGNYFHTNGPTFLPCRKCLHCGLHVLADKKG